MPISVRIFGFPLELYRPLAEEADRLGFHGVFVPDHLVAPLEVGSEYPYAASGKPTFALDTPFADPWVMLGHLAATTERILLGVGVFVLPLRNAFAVAKAAATLQQLSRGRLVFGIGTGWVGEEFDVLGAPFERRGARSEEMIEVVRKLWSGEPVEHHGRWIRFPRVQMSPPAGPPIPLLLGGTSRPALRRAARLGDGWYCPPATLDDAREYRQAIDTARRAAGTADRPFRFVARVPAPATLGSVTAYLEAGFDDLVVEVPRDVPELDGQLEWLRQLAAALTGAGVRLAY